LAIVGWLIRSLIKHLLSKDIETYKLSLQSSSTVELERLRHSLSLIASEHEKQIHILQERRAKVIEELYVKLIDFLVAAESFVSIVEYSGEPSKEEKAVVLSDKATDFYNYFLRHQIYFTAATCDRIRALLQDVKGSALGFRFWMVRSDKSQQAAQKMDDAWDAAWKAMKDKVPSALAAVENEFRILLA
jgi:hypothetical protein